MNLAAFVFEPNQSGTSSGVQKAWHDAHRGDEIVPYILTLSKSLGCGLALSSVSTTAEIAKRAVERGFLWVTTHQNDPLAVPKHIVELFILVTFISQVLLVRTTLPVTQFFTEATLPQTARIYLKMFRPARSWNKRLPRRHVEMHLDIYGNAGYVAPIAKSFTIVSSPAIFSSCGALLKSGPLSECRLYNDDVLR